MTKTKIYLWILDLWPDTVFDYKFIKKSHYLANCYHSLLILFIIIAKNIYT